MELTTHQASALDRLRDIDTAQGDTQELLDAVVRIAKDFFQPLQVECGITVVNSSQVFSVAQTTSIIETIEQAQGPDEGGPVYNSLERGTSTVVDEALVDPRWPDYLQVVAARGFHSILSMCLVTAGTTKATINLYAAPPRSFTEDLCVAGERFAAESARRLRTVFRTPLL